MALIGHVLFIFAILSGAVQSADWDYDTKGPATWPTAFPVCAGKSQSPIDIKAADAKIDSNLKLFDRDWYYALPDSMSLTNNGHSLQMNIVGGNTIKKDYGFLPFEAKLAQYHFHFGTNKSAKGAEHTLDTKQYYGELHAVHYNTKYTGLGTALNQSDGLAVLGFFIKVGYPQNNKMYDNIFDYLSTAGVMNESSTVDLTSAQRFSLETLIQPDTSVYYRYKGSLTTPTCDESVEWTVFENPIEISEAQAMKLSDALFQKGGEGAKVGGNFRPVQNLNGRTVSKPVPLSQDSSAGGIKPSLLLASLSIILAFVTSGNN